MTGSPFKPVATGDPVRPSARWHNAATETINAFQTGKQQLSGRETLLKKPEGLIYLKNSSGQDLDRFAVVGLQDVLISPAENLAELQNNPALIGELPTKPDYLGTFGICYEPIAEGKIGRVFVTGTSPVQVNVTDTTHAYADITDSDTTQLTSQATASAGCAQILNNTSTTGKQWCLIRFPLGGGGDAISWGVLQSPWTPGSASVTLQPCEGPLSASPILDGSGSPVATISCYVQIPVGSAQYLGANSGDILGYVSTSGIHVLFQVPLPQLSSQYQGWYNNATTGSNVVADYLKTF